MKRLAILALSAGLVFAGSADAAPSKKAKIKQPAAATSIATPLSASETLSAALATYASFQLDVAAVRANRPKTSKEVEATLDRLSAYNPAALARGWVAYGGLAAAQSPAFAAEVSKVAAAHKQDKAVLWFSTIPHYAASLNGADDATRVVLSTAANDGERINKAGDEYKLYALSLQKQAWAKARFPKGAGSTRFARLNALSKAGGQHAVAPELLAKMTGAPVATTADAGALGGRLFWEAAARGGVETASLTAFSPEIYHSSNPEHRSTLNAMLSLAALKNTGGVESISGGAMEQMLSDRAASNCFASAQQQFSQCVSAAASMSDAVACIGEAGLQTRGACVAKVVSPQTTASLH